MEQQSIQAEGTTRRSLLVRGAVAGAAIGVGGLLAMRGACWPMRHRP